VCICVHPWLVFWLRSSAFYGLNSNNATAKKFIAAQIKADKRRKL
jgi:hypothetical protein